MSAARHWQALMGTQDSGEDRSRPLLFRGVGSTGIGIPDLVLVGGMQGRQVLALLDHKVS